MPSARYHDLVAELAEAIRSGKLTPGTQLPTHRQLAKQQNIALVSASRVYAELAKMGLVSGETGRGTFVRDTALPAHHGVDQRASLGAAAELNFNSPTLPQQAEALREALRQLAASGDLASLLHYQPHLGRSHERSLIAEHLHTRGVDTTAEQVAIVNGAQQGLATVVMALLQPGDRVAVDALTYPGFKALAKLHQLRLYALPYSPQGPDLEALAKLCARQRIRAYYSMPTVHNPLGWVMSAQRRKPLVRIARQYGLWLIEDAAYAFLEARPPAPLASLAPECTLYVSGL